MDLECEFPVIFFRFQFNPDFDIQFLSPPNPRLVLKEEASDYLELETIKNLVRKYSQFINFPIYVWASKVSTLTFSSTLLIWFPLNCVMKQKHVELTLFSFLMIQTETVEEPIEEDAEAEEPEKETSEDEAEVEEEEEADKDKPKTKKVSYLSQYRIF